MKKVKVKAVNRYTTVVNVFICEEKTSCNGKSRSQLDIAMFVVAVMTLLVTMYAAFAK